MEFAYDGGGLAKGGDVTLYYDGDPVGSGRVETTQPFLFSADETTDVGYDTGTAGRARRTPPRRIHRHHQLGPARPRRRRPRPPRRPRRRDADRDGDAVARHMTPSAGTRACRLLPQTRKRRTLGRGRARLDGFWIPPEAAARAHVLTRPVGSEVIVVSPAHMPRSSGDAELQTGRGAVSHNRQHRRSGNSREAQQPAHEWRPLRFRIDLRALQSILVGRENDQRTPMR